jgi:hypothetical protein
LIAVLFGNVLAVVAFVVLGLTQINPTFGVVLLGVHFSLMPAALWPCIELLVEPKHESVSSEFSMKFLQLTILFRGIAFAVISALMNASLTAVIPLAGSIGDSTGGFTRLCLFFAMLSLFSVGMTVVWHIVDARHDSPSLNTFKGEDKEM